MRADHTPTSRGAYTATTLLVLVQVLNLVMGDHEPYVVALLVALVLGTSAASVKLHRDNCVESRLAVSLLATANGGGVALAMTLGPPGQMGGGRWNLVAASVLALSAAVLVLLAIDQARRAASRRDDSPYAV
ncbi:MAG: hypothetical protein JWR55_1881 [Aeromicrobium sp.]|jgi:hypothetical protein|nr:hypothetical protein [Aeromicrobium sp.]